MLPAITSELITYSKTCVNGDGGHLPWKWVKVWPKRKGILGNAVTWKLPEVLADENGTVPWKSLCSWRRSRPAACDSTSVRPSPEPTAWEPSAWHPGQPARRAAPQRGGPENSACAPTRGKPLGVTWLVGWHSYPRPPYGNKTYTLEGKTDNSH